MTSKKIKIEYYALKMKRKYADEYITELATIEKVLGCVQALDLHERRFDMKFAEKAHFLFDARNSNGTLLLSFHSGEFGKTPPIIHRLTGEERENPRLRDESDRSKTHFGMRKMLDEILVIKENSHGSGLSMKHFADYLLYFSGKYYENENKELDFTLEYSQLVRTDFFEELQKLKKISVGAIYADKSILHGSEAYNDFIGTEHIKDEIVISVKAENLQSVPIAFIRKILGNSKMIHKIRIEGKSEDNVLVRLVSDSFKRVEYVDTAIDSNGEVIGESLLSSIQNLLVQFKDDAEIILS